MWGAGDGAAALIGVPFGKHKVKIKPADGKKSWEGSAAMFIVALLCGTAMLIFAQKLSIPHAIIYALVGAFAGTVTELFTPSEFDTVTVPITIQMLLLILNL